MIKKQIEELFKDAIQKALEAGKLGELKEVPESIELDKCKNPEHGDRAVSIAMRLAKPAKMAPLKIAEAIVGHLDVDAIGSVEVAAPGFINITFNWTMLEQIIAQIHKEGESFGYVEKSNVDQNHVLLEYVSANPTGNLHIGHGRQAVVGSAIASLLDWAGYNVESEFYINDAGVQIEKLGKSAKLAIMVSEGQMNADDYPHNDENYYPLDSFKEILNPVIYQLKIAQLQGVMDIANFDLNELKEEVAAEIAEELFLIMQEKILREIHVNFDTWFSEKANLHKEEDNKVAEVCEEMKGKDVLYEEDGALWFKAKAYGDDRDRVMRKSQGFYTYLAADIAYHKNKFDRGYDHIINIWGSDHHGQEPGLRGALKSIELDEEKLELIFIQMVSLKQDGKEVKMSKRKGTIVNVDQLVAEVGVDAMRFFLVDSQVNNRMVFDLELAKKQDKDNPVYYVQYAHARASSILRNLTRPRISQELGQGPTQEEPLISQTELDGLLGNIFQDCSQETIRKGFDKAEMSEEELRVVRAFILELQEFPEIIENAARDRAPYKITVYLKHLAALFHEFYNENRVMGVAKEVMLARLDIITAAQSVIRNALTLLGISAPDRM